jgi:predicted nucleotidyltransferase
VPNDEIISLKDKIVEQLSPLKVYLFGSFADGTSDEGSDYDFYVIVEDSKTDWYDQTIQAYRAIRPIRTRPVDILVGTESAFEKRKAHAGIEQEVFRKGVLLYG